ELYEYVAEEKGISVRTRFTQPRPDKEEPSPPTPLPSDGRGGSDGRGEPAPVIVKVDRIRMRQVFANLLDNALKYTAQGGKVTISVREEATEAVASFQDNGVGIPPEEQEKIWLRLYRGDKSRSQRGLGLGLS